MQKYKKIMHVVPTDSKNDLIMDFLTTEVAKQFSHFVMTLEPGTKELSEFCQLNKIPISVPKKVASLIVKTFLVHKTIKRVKPDEVHFHSFFPSIVGAIISGIPGRTFCCYAVRHHNRNHIIMNHRKAIIVDRFISKIVDKTICVSQSVHRTVIQQGAKKSKLIVIENGVRYERYNFKTRPVKRIKNDGCIKLLAVGRLDWQKNYSLLLSIAKELQSDGANFEIQILGSGNSGVLDLWKEETKRLGLEDYIVWHGWVSDVSPFYSNAEIFIHTAMDEACPLALIEALLSGIPIVSTSNGGCKDVMAPYYKGIPSQNPVAFMNEIKKIAKDYEKYQIEANSYVESAKKRFSSELAAKRYLLDPNSRTL